MFAHYDFNWPKADREEVSAELRAEMVDDLYAQYADDDAKRREAEEWVAGTFDGSHYTDLTLALFDLHNTDPDKLLGSGVLTRLYHLAKVEHTALAAKLREMAEQAVDGAA
jgi:hypothetical protein